MHCMRFTHWNVQWYCAEFALTAAQCTYIVSIHYTHGFTVNKHGALSVYTQMHSEQAVYTARAQCMCSIQFVHNACAVYNS